MDKLTYCLRCFQDVERWEELVATSTFLAIRCPYCKAVHSIYPDGTVRVQS
ncbi:MAG TPA: hypothetical protein VHQ46_01505 [Desulfobacteria bacterium]|nr:hypothetical protein [Desulfobacteria bacterium]